MANSLIKQLLPYSLLVVGYLVVRRYISTTSVVPRTSSTSDSPHADATASAIIELTESMEYNRRIALHIPESDEEALVDVMSRLYQAQKDLEALVTKYIHERGLDLEGEDILEVQDRRGRQVKISLEDWVVVEFPDQIGYREQQRVLSNSKWANEF